jgi:transcriptional regulator GlxA family with amidase domain
MPPDCRCPVAPISGIIDIVRDKAANPIPLAIVVYDQVALFDLGVAREVFGTDVMPLYDVTICGPADSVMTDAGISIGIRHGLDVLQRSHTVVVLPTYAPSDEVPDSVIDAVREAGARGARLLSLCTGAFVLAATGLLDGRRATTHWTECAELKRRYPRIAVDPGVLYVDEGEVLTSAGSAAGIDLCLHVVQADYGAEIAARVARDLVVPLHRDGGQAQFIETPMPEDTELFTGTLEWVREHLREPVTVRDLAARSAMSPRTFSRKFAASTGTTPYQWLLRERLALARRLLETTDLPVETIAHTSGLQTAGNLRKHFGRELHTTPQAYRRAFRVPSAPAAGNAT